MKRTPIIEWQAAVSNNKGDNKKAFIGYYHPIITIYYHPYCFNYKTLVLPR